MQINLSKANSPKR
ncbi:Protein of unknown function [Bacillus mycoides]|uniref:Uncharacterized protein n=1 Tax=Bacillus mycoides TaxID=1405 RepID=A0A1G4EMM7_BACMY|nr:Protein of unknown function [Bacillus mycoides]